MLDNFSFIFRHIRVPITMKRMKRGFLDSLRLYLRGGSGGMGYPRFGGVGGNGGNIYVEAKEGKKTSCWLFM